MVYTRIYYRTALSAVSRYMLQNYTMTFTPVDVTELHYKYTSVYIGEFYFPL